MYESPSMFIKLHHTYECKDPLALKFKQAIDTTCEKHQISI